MTFEQWWEEVSALDEVTRRRDYAEEAWKAATRVEREACAKVCEEEAQRWQGEQDITDFRLCAAAIRARSMVTS
jgi:hypothetical protein